MRLDGKNDEDQYQHHLIRYTLIYTHAPEKKNAQQGKEKQNNGQPNERFENGQRALLCTHEKTFNMIATKVVDFFSIVCLISILFALCWQVWLFSLPVMLD